VEGDSAGESGAEEEAGLEAQVRAAENGPFVHDTHEHPLGKDDFFVGEKGEDFAWGEIEAGFEFDFGFGGAFGGVFEAGGEAAEAEAEPVATAEGELSGGEGGEAEPLGGDGLVELGAGEAVGVLEAELVAELFDAGGLEVFFAFGGGGEGVLLILEAGPVLVGDVEEVLEFEFEVGRDGVVAVDDGIEVATADAESLGGADLGDATLFEEVAKGFAGLSWDRECHENTNEIGLQMTKSSG
jgi:hypothetical protein